MTLQETTPEVVICDTPEEVDTYATKKLVDQMQKKPDSSLTLPTGNTPVGMYVRIVDMYKQGKIDLSKATIFSLDEYYPIESNNLNSFASFMKQNLIDHMPIGKWYIPNGEAQDATIEAERYRQLLEHYQPIDLTVLGIGPGTTCHIGFNEKGSPIDSTVRYVKLHDETRVANSKNFLSPKEIPTGGITQGISDILQAKQILVIAKGEAKAWGVKRALHGPISSDAPASFLRLHPHVTFVIDRGAAQLLS